MKRRDFCYVVSLVLVLAFQMTVLTGCVKTKQLETTTESPDYTLDHIDTFYPLSYAGKKNPYNDEWERSHLIGDAEAESFGISSDKICVFDMENVELTVVDYSSKKATEMAVPGFDDKKILETRFSGDELLVLSLVGDKGFKSSKYYFSILDLNGVIKSESEITSAFPDDVPHLGLSIDGFYPVFSSNQVLLWDSSKNTFINESFNSNDKAGFVVRDVKCFSDRRVGILLGKTGDAEEYKSCVVLSDCKFKNCKNYEFDVHAERFSYGDDVIAYGFYSLFKVTDTGCEIICNWEDVHLNMPFSVLSEGSLIRVLTTFTDLDYEYSGYIMPLNNLFLFNVSKRDTKDIATVKLAALGMNQYYNIEFLTDVFNLTHDDIRIELKQFNIAEEFYNEYTASIRKAYLEMSNESYDLYFFPHKPLINSNDLDNYLKINEKLCDRLSNDKCYTKMAFGEGDESYFLHPFFSLAGSYYCESGFGDRPELSEVDTYYCRMLPNVCAETDEELFEKLFVDDPSYGGKYIYDDELSLSDYLDYSIGREVKLSGIPGVSGNAPMVNSCGGFAFNKDIDLNIAAEIANFLLSDFVQSFTHEEDSVFPATRKNAAFQVSNWLFVDYSSIVSVVYDGTTNKNPWENRNNPQEKLPYANKLLDSFDSVSVIFEPDPVIGMIFSEEYRLYVEGTVSREAFRDSYSKRISLYLSEINN